MPIRTAAVPGLVSLVLAAAAGAVLPPEVELVPGPEGEADLDFFGGAVAGPGDLDGDGTPDVVVGAASSDAAGTSAGRVTIHTGGWDLVGGEVIILDGAQPGGAFGHQLSVLGDVNRDGWGDLAVSAPFHDGAFENGGRIYVYHGGPSFDATPDVIANGYIEDQLMGYVLSSRGGDVDGDGRNDLMAGSPFLDDGEDQDTGAAYLFYGAGAGPAVIWFGSGPLDYFGWSVEIVGDVNADGFDDVIIGTPDEGNGLAELFLGGSPFDPVRDLTMLGGGAATGFGEQISAAGDVNGDGYADWLIAARNDLIRLYLGADSPSSSPAATFVSGDPRTATLGFRKACVVDLDRDGFDDLVVSDHEYDRDPIGTGRIYVFHGSASPDLVPDLVFDGPHDGAYFGSALAAVGDLGLDRYPDVIVGAMGWERAPGDRPGRVDLLDPYVYKLTHPRPGDVLYTGGQVRIGWKGAEPANLGITVDGGLTVRPLPGAQGVGGRAVNEWQVQVPHAPSRFARVAITAIADPTETVLSPGQVTIDASVSLGLFRAVPRDGGGMRIEWQTTPGPEHLAGYRLERRRAASAGTDASGWEVLAALTTATAHADVVGAPGDRYRLTAINGLGGTTFLGTVDPGGATSLSAGPVPLRAGSVRIDFAVTGDRGRALGPVRVSIHDVRGREVRVLLDGDLPAAGHRTSWDGRDASGRRVSAGVYFVRVATLGRVESLRIPVTW